MNVRRGLATCLLGAACVSASLPGCSTARNNGIAKTPPPADLPVANFPVEEEESGGGWFSRKRKLKNPVKMHLAYAQWQEQLGQVDNARKSYETVLEQDPKSVDALLGLARLDQLAGRTTEADLGYQKALQRNPKDPHVLDAYGQFLAAQGDWERAVQTLEQAMQAAPEEPIYRYHLAVALAKSGKIVAAMPHFVRSVGEAEAHYNIGYILYQQGNLDESEQQFLQAVTKKPQLAQAQAMLDKVRDDREEARLMLAGTAKPAHSPQAARSQVQQASTMGMPTPTAPVSPAAGVAPALPPEWSQMTPQQREQWANQMLR